MKLSIVVICWNDRKVIMDCLRSIFAETGSIEFEVIVSDNGSTDGAPDEIRREFPSVRIVENGANLGFAKGNNAGIRVATGEFVLILNPDTIILDRALEKLLAYAEQHSEAGAFGCRVLNPDGSYQNPARPLPSFSGSWLAALNVRWLAKVVPGLETDVYSGWEGRSEREVGFQSGCCVLVRGALLQKLGGFDERFFYHYEETDLCLRVWKSGAPILFFPGAEITHLGGQSVGRFPIRFRLETNRSLYRYFFKHYGLNGVRRIRRVTLVSLWLRRLGYGLQALVKPSEVLSRRLEMYQVAIAWNSRLDPKRFIESGEEPDLGYEPLQPAPVMTEPSSNVTA